MSEHNNTSFQRLADSAAEFVRSEKRGRWFTNFLKLAVAIYLIGSLALLSHGLSQDLETDLTPHVARVSLTGPIMPETLTSAEAVIPLLQDAFKHEQSKAVILHVNSPGGSAVQSGLIYDEIKRLKTLYPNKPIITVVEDLCASGCYYIASATDKIYADKASILGSIGVRFDGVGITGLMEKLGIENRSLAAGEHKRLMDPLSPVDTQAQQHLQKHLLEKTHEQFKQAVRTGRGDRLKETPDLFTGLVWVGEEAVGMGLIDGLGELHSIARDELHEEHIVDYATKVHWLDKLSSNIGAQLALTLQKSAQPRMNFSY
jgi:protease-4